MLVIPERLPARTISPEDPILEGLGQTPPPDNGLPLHTMTR